MQSLVAGEVDAGFLASSGALPHVQAGRMVPLMVPGNQRDPAFPDVPSASELGIQNFDVDGAFVLLAPKGVSEEVKAVWADEVQRLFDNPEFIQILNNLTLRAEWGDAAQTQEWLDRTAMSWKEVIDKRDIRLQ